MSYSAPGERVEVEVERACVHGQIIVCDSKVGRINKVGQLDRFVRPESAEATAMEVGEVGTLVIIGIVETPAADALAAAVKGDLIYIDPTDDTLKRNAGAEGDLPVGVVDEVDVTRTPDVVRINLNAWQAFLPVPAAA